MKSLPNRTAAASLALCIAYAFALVGCQTLGEAHPVSGVETKDARYYSSGARSLENSDSARLYLPNMYYRGVDGESTIGIIRSVIKLTPGSHEVMIAEQGARPRTLRYDFEKGRLFLFAQVSKFGFALYQADDGQWVEIETYAGHPYSSEFHWQPPGE